MSMFNAKSYFKLTLVLSLSSLFILPLSAYASTTNFIESLSNYMNSAASASSSYTSIGKGSAGDHSFSVDYYDENKTKQTLYYKVYNGTTALSSVGSRLDQPIGDVYGDFIGIQSDNTNGGVLYAGANTGNIIGNFIGNTTSSNSPTNGSLYINNANIDYVIGNFIGNSCIVLSGYSSGGALYIRNSTVNNIIGDFIGNSQQNPTGNYGYSGAISAMNSTISFLANNRTNTFSDNYFLTSSNSANYTALYLHNNATANFNMQGSGAFVMNDRITTINTSTTSLNINGQSIYNIFYLNNTTSGIPVTVNNATLQLGSYLHANGTTTYGYTSDMTSAITLNNALLSFDLIDYDYDAGNKEFTLASTLTFNGNSYANVKNANIGDYKFGNGTNITADNFSSASSLHTTTNTGTNNFEIAFNPNSTLIEKSQLGSFMLDINDNFSAQSEDKINRFIFQASQYGTDTQKQAGIIDSGASLSAIGASNANTLSAISAKQDSINTRITQELAYNVSNLVASNTDNSIMTIKNSYDIGAWIMPSFNHERVSGLDAISFEHGYTSDQIGLALGIDKTFNTNNMQKYFIAGLALDTGFGTTETTGDVENIKNNFNYYGASVYAAMYNKNLIINSTIGYERNNSEIKLDLDKYNLLESQATDTNTNAIYASAKAEYQYEFKDFSQLKYIFKKESEAEKEEKQKVALLQKNIAVLEGLIGTYDKEGEENTKTVFPPDSRFGHLNISIVPYVGVDFRSISTGEYEVYSDNNSAVKDVTFNVESERQNIITIPLGVQVRREKVLESEWTMVPQLSLGMAYSFGDLYETSISKAKGYESISLESQTLNPLRGDFAVQANFHKENANIDLGYDLQASKNRFLHNFSLKAEYKF